MSSLVDVWYLVVVVCAAPDYQECKFLRAYEQRSGIQCQFNRPVADHIWQRDYDMTYAVTFSRCEVKEEILIDNRPEPPGKRGR